MASEQNIQLILKSNTLMKQKIIVCLAVHAEGKIGPLLEDGYKVIFCTTETIAITADDRTYSRTERGLIIFILEKK